MNISDILANKGGEVVTVSCDTPVREAVSILAERRIGATPVMRDGRVIGIMSERDVIYCLKAGGAEMLDWPVEKVMSTPAIVAEPGMPVLAGLSMLTERRIRHLPVVVNELLVGFV